MAEKVFNISKNIFCEYVLKNKQSLNKFIEQNKLILNVDYDENHCFTTESYLKYVIFSKSQYGKSILLNFIEIVLNHYGMKINDIIKLEMEKRYNMLHEYEVEMKEFNVLKKMDEVEMKEFNVLKKMDDVEIESIKINKKSIMLNIVEDRLIERGHTLDDMEKKIPQYDIDIYNTVKDNSKVCEHISEQLNKFVEMYKI